VYRNNERNAGWNNFVTCYALCSYVLKYDRRIAVDSAAWLVTRESTPTGKKKKKKRTVIASVPFACVVCTCNRRINRAMRFQKRTSIRWVTKLSPG